jgi:hypothetical protein
MHTLYPCILNQSDYHYYTTKFVSSILSPQPADDVTSTQAASELWLCELLAPIQLPETANHNPESPPELSCSATGYPS